MRTFPLSPLHAAIAGLVLVATLLFSSTAHAQLYTWKDAQGNVMIKNAPPPWYSEFERSRGARVQVLRNGKVVDDTAWPPEARQEGRNKDSRDEAKRAEAEAATREVRQPKKAIGKDDDD